MIKMKEYKIALPKPTTYNNKRNLADYTKPELDRFRRLCNFTDDESEYFNLRSNGNSNIAITMSMCISESKLYDIRRRVENKIKKVS
jgi:hypothetical protein